MLNFGSGEILLILFVSLVLFGPKELVQISRWLGSIFGKINQLSLKMRRELNLALNFEEKIDESFDPRNLTKDVIASKLRSIKQSKNGGEA